MRKGFGGYERGLLKISFELFIIMQAICSFFLMFVSIIAFGQKTFVSIGGHIVAPTSFGIKRVAGTGFGGSLRLETSFGKHINGIATIEYLTFAEIKTDQNTSKFTALPIQIGIKYYITSKENASDGFFISGEIGKMATRLHRTYTSGNPDLNRKESDLIIAPGLGYQFGKAEASFRPQFNLSDSGFNIYYLNFRLTYAI